MRTPRIRLSIDRLVLRGLPLEHRDAFVRALHAELTRLLALQGFARGLAARRVASVRADRLRVQGHDAPGRLGVQVAQGVVRGIRG
jgi:hypothetical protein